MGGPAAGHDSYRIQSPLGTIIELASWIRVDDGPDFGDSWMAARYAQNTLAEGGQLAYETIGVRTMSFPLQVPSGAYNPITFPFHLQETESLLRLMARPGAVLDIQVTGASDVVRFDVLDGRWKPDYVVRHQAIAIRRGTLEVDVQPFGYLPTDIILASAASVGLPGFVTFSAPIGDVPGLAELTVVPTVPTSFPGASWYPDFIAWSLHGQGASFAALFPAGSIATVAGIGATYTADAFAISSQAYETVGKVTWTPVGAAIIPAALESSYRGRHRLWALAKLAPSQGLPFYVSADVVIAKSLAEMAGLPMGSAAPIATLFPVVASGGSTAGDWLSASPAYQLLDLGEVSLPPVASGQSFQQAIRLWTVSATTTLPVPTPYVRFDSLWLQPLPMAGVLTQNLRKRSRSVEWGTATEPPGLSLDNVTGRLFTFRSDASQSPLHDAGGDYRGVLPGVGASTLRLDVTAYSRLLSASAQVPVARTAAGYANVSLTYRPRFAFLRGL